MRRPSRAQSTPVQPFGGLEVIARGVLEHEGEVERAHGVTPGLEHQHLIARPVSVEPREGVQPLHRLQAVDDLGIARRRAPSASTCSHSIIPRTSASTMQRDATTERRAGDRLTDRLLPVQDRVDELLPFADIRSARGVRRVERRCFVAPPCARERALHLAHREGLDGLDHAPPRVGGELHRGRPGELDKSKPTASHRSRRAVPR